MHVSEDDSFARTDVWREGKWLDLWSVVHFLTGISVGLGFAFLRFDPLAASLLALVSLIAYEMWEHIVGIDETPTNRFMDVVVGMTSFLPTFFLAAPSLSRGVLVFAFLGVLAIDIQLSVFGWRASQKAAVLERRMKERYAKEKVWLRERRETLREKFNKQHAK